MHTALRMQIPNNFSKSKTKLTGNSLFTPAKIAFPSVKRMRFCRQLLARLGSRLSIKGLEPYLFARGPDPGSVVELFGAEGTGKTEVLLHCVAKCILPQKWLVFNLGGLGTKVIFIDTDYKLSILRLVILLEKKITEIINSQDVCDKKPSSDEVEGFITECLKNLLVLRCSSSEQLVCTLHSLETSICSDTDISCIMIDSISAFYWLDRCNHSDGVSGHEKNINKIVNILETISKKYNLVVMVTKAAIFKAKIREYDKGDNSSSFVESLSKGDAPSTNCVEYLGKTWNKFVGERLILKADLSGGNTVFTATHKSTTLSSRFTISESGIHFL